MNDKRFSPLRTLGAIGLGLALLFLGGCRPLVSQPPAAPPSATPAPAAPPSASPAPIASPSASPAPSVPPSPSPPPTVPTPASPAITPQCTPELVTRVCKESAFCYDDRGWAWDAVWAFFAARYPDEGPKYGITLWPRYLVGQVTTDSGTFDVYTDSEGGWTLSIGQGEPPIRFILADDAGTLRWEGLAAPRQSCEGCICQEVYDPSEVSVKLPSSTRTPECEPPGFRDIMQAALAHVRQKHPEEPLSDDLIGGVLRLAIDWTTRPTRVTVTQRDAGFRWEGEMVWHADEACRLQVDGFTELPPATPTPAPVAGPAPTATPAGPPDFSALHLGWVWPAGQPEVKDWFAVDSAGNAYVTDGNGRLHALRPPGEEVWAFDEGEEGMAPPVLGPDGKTLYVLTLMPDTLWALGTDGERRLAADLEHQPIALPIVAPDGVVYVSTMGGGYRYPSGGKEPTEFSWSDYFGPESAAFDPQGRLYARDFGEVWVNSSEGKQERTCTIKELYGSLAGWPAGGFVYSTSGGDLIAADPECKEIWRYAGGKAEPSAGWDPVAVTSDGAVYAARESGEIVALDTLGKPRWKHEPDEQSGALLHLLPAPGGTLYAVTAKGEVLAFDAQGKKVWTHKLPAAGKPGPPQLTPGGGIALVQGGRLWYFTPDPALSAAEPTPVPLPANMDAAREEIVKYLLDQLGCSIESIFIWAPASDTSPLSATHNPIRVWWCSGGKLTERKDMQEAMAEAQKRNAEADPTARTYPVAYFEFTVDADESLQRAEVYVGWNRGPLWGEGNVYTLERSATGEWWVADSKQTWIS